MAKTELEKIKNKWGEKFMQICRACFSTILENEGILYQLLEDSFAHNARDLGDLIEKYKLEEDFKNYIYNKYNEIKPEKCEIKEENKNPYELLNEAGYNLYECKTAKDVRKFKKYYTPTEKLCTFWDIDARLDKCICYFAVKKNVKEIKRKNFKEPRREDEYGTSVLGIQFNKEGKCIVSIKNRYNHTVNNPDATFKNNLDKLVPGLTEAFREELNKKGLSLFKSNVERFEIPGYVLAGDGKYYRYNSEMNGIYYCPGNIVIKNGQVERLENHKILINNFVINVKDKTIKMYDERANHDSFVDYFETLGTEDKIIIDTKDKASKTRTITVQIEGQKPVEITINKDNQIIGYKNNNLKNIKGDFLIQSSLLKQLELTELQSMGNYCACNANGLTNLELPKLRSMGNCCFYNANGLTKLKLPELENMGNGCFSNIEELTNLELSELKNMGNACFICVQNLTNIYLPKLQSMGNTCFVRVENLKNIYSPKLQSIGNACFSYLYKLTNLELSGLKDMGNACFCDVKNLKKLRLPRLQHMGEGCFDGTTSNMIRGDLKTLSGKNSTIVLPRDIAEASEKREVTKLDINWVKRFIARFRFQGR